MKRMFSSLIAVLTVGSSLCGGVSEATPVDLSRHHHDSQEKYNTRSFGINLFNWRKTGPTDISPKNVHLLGNPIFNVNSNTAVNSTPAIVDGIGYYFEDDGYAHAFDAVTGNPIWTSPQIQGSSYLTPAVGKDLLFLEVDTRFVPPTTNYVTALRRSDGGIQWQQSVDDIGVNGVAGFTAPVLIEDEDIVIFCHDYFVNFGSASYAKIRGYRASTGALLWTYQTSQVGVGQPNSGTGGAGIFGTPAVNPKTGLLYVGTGQNTYSGPPPLPGSYVFTPITDSVLVLDYRTGQYVWHHQFTADDVDFIVNGGTAHTKNWDAFSVILLNTCINDVKKDVVVVGTKEGVAYCLDQVTGELYWQTHLNGPVPSGYEFESIFIPGSGNGGVNGPGCTDGSTLYFSSIYSATGLPLSTSNPTNFAEPVSEVFAIRSCDGTVLWRSERFRGTVFGPLTYSCGIVWTPVVAGTFTYEESPIVQRGAVLRALDSRNGRVLYEFAAAPDGVNASILRSFGGVSIYKDFVYFPWGSFTPNPGGIFVFKLP